MKVRLGYLLAISLALHVLGLVLLVSPEFARMMHRWQPAPPPRPAPPVLKLVKLAPPPPPPPKTSFIPTLPSQEVAQQNPDAPFEAARNTQLRSRDPAKDPSSLLPSQVGDPRAGLNDRDTPSSRPVKSAPSEAVPQKPVQQQQQQQPPSPKQPAQQAAPPQENVAKAEPVTPAPRAEAVADKPVPRLPPPDLAYTVPLTPPPASPPPPARPPTPQIAPSTPTPPTPPTPRADPTKPSPASPPPQPQSLSQQRGQIAGASPRIGDSSPEAKQSEIGRYKDKLYRMIGSRWYLNVDRYTSVISIGEVHIRYFIQANGVIDPKRIQIVDSTGDTAVLQSISMDAVGNPANQMEPFSDAMKQQLGDGFWEDITFTIY